jgi:hypothetical protein
MSDATDRRRAFGLAQLSGRLALLSGQVTEQASLVAHAAATLADTSKALLEPTSDKDAAGIDQPFTEGTP